MLGRKAARISIIVCTYNGEKTLLGCLDSLESLDYPKNKLEILIVDNSSTDSTKEIAREFIKKLRFKSRYFFESSLGLSSARNKGVKEARGDIIAFIDDDAVANENWLKEMIENFEDAEVWAVGGRVIPKYEIIPPNWLPENQYLFPLTICDLGEDTKEVPHLVGTNMAFRKKVFEKIGYFRTDLGRKGENLLSGEEIDFCERLAKTGKKIIYNPLSIIEHLVSKERLSKRFFIRRLFIEGVSLARMDRVKYDFKVRLKRLVCRLFELLSSALSGVLIFNLTGDAEKKFSCLCNVLINLGYLYETLFPFKLFKSF